MRIGLDDTFHGTVSHQPERLWISHPGGRRKGFSVQDRTPAALSSRGFFPPQKFRANRVFAQKLNMARPAFKPTTAMRKQVAIAAGAGMSHDDIALGIGITRNTLTKHFEKELAGGAAAKRLAVLSAMYATAVKGNVAAQKAYIAMTPTNAATGQGAGKPLGKKEQAQADANGAEAGTGWEGLLGSNVTPIRGAG